MAASATDKLMEVGLSTATTLSAPGYTAGATSITVAATTNWPTATGIIFAIDTVSIVNGVEVQDAGTYCEFQGTVASATSITNVDYVDGNGDQDFAAGSTTRVYIPVSKTRENRIVTWGLVQHKQDGTHANTITTDTINENTAANGVTIDGLNIKDSKLVTSDSVVTANITDAAVTSEKLNCTVAFHAYRNGAWSFDNANQTKIQLETELYDAGSDFDATTNHRFNAPVNGFYYFSARSGGDNTSRRGQASLYVNGAQVITGNSQVATFVGATVSGVLKLATNDYVELYFQSDATDAGATGYSACYLTGALIGRY